MTDADPLVPRPVGRAAQRAGDADRDAVAEILRVAATEGRIDTSELAERLGQLNQAKTYGELDALMADLPADHGRDTLVLRTTTADIRQAGRWVVPRLITAESTTGWITIDFTQAACAHREVTVQVVTKTAWIELILPGEWAARVAPLGTYTGHISNKAAGPPDPGAPLVTVTGDPAFGYIKIRQRYRRR